MVRLRPGWMAVVALLSAAALAGCASDRGSRQTACCCESSAPVTQSSSEPRPGSEVRLAAFETGGSAGAPPAPVLYRPHAKEGDAAATDWAAWWDEQADSFWADVVPFAPAITGDAPGRDRAREISRESVARFLRDLLAKTDARVPDLRGATWIALGKTTSEPADVDAMAAAAKDPKAPALEREGATIALGLLRRTEERCRFYGRLLDQARAHLFEVFDERRTPRSLRCFATRSRRTCAG